VVEKAVTRDAEDQVDRPACARRLVDLVPVVRQANLLPRVLQPSSYASKQGEKRYNDMGAKREGTC